MENNSDSGTLKFSNPVEQWRDVVGYEGKYQISSTGRIIGFGKNIGIMGTHERNGYTIKSLYKDGKQKMFKVHRLVAIAFIPNPENKPFINHKNGIKTDNRVENLEWCTASENRKHADSTGLRTPSRGENNPHSKLTEQDVIFIRNSDDSYASLAKKFNVSDTTIRRIAKGERWNHVKDLEKENQELKALCREVLTAREQYQFFVNGYANGSASISEANHASTVEHEAYSKLWDYLKSKAQ